MPQKGNTLILKFGGGVALTPESFGVIAELILERSKEFSHIAIVVSAMQGMTDRLISLARAVHPSPPKREYDMLVSAGERISISLLAMALECKGGKAVSFTGSQSGILTCGSHGMARIVGMKPSRILSAFDEGKIAIVAGFQGMSLEREITTLGRGGSDTTAVALGVALGAERVEFYKDVPGIFSSDPKLSAGEFYPTLSYGRALEIAERGGVVHPRAIMLAAKYGLPLRVRGMVSSECTEIVSEKRQEVTSEVSEDSPPL